MPREDGTAPLPRSGYPVDTEYPVRDEGRAASENTEGGAEASESADAGADAPFWKRLGFASFEAYLAELARLRDLYEPRPRRRRSLAELPGQELGKLVVSRREPLSHQVNVKLRVEDWHALCAAASEFGIAPTTLARLIVERGVEAIAGD
jgi:hypothetical protein